MALLAGFRMYHVILQFFLFCFHAVHTKNEKNNDTIDCVGMVGALQIDNYKFFYNQYIFEKAKPIARWGRKATGLQVKDGWVAKN